MIEADARRTWNAYVGKGDKFGSFAAWCADQYLLGRKARCTAAAAQGLAHGSFHDAFHVNATPGKWPYWPGGKRYIAWLKHNLHAWGYDTP